jgi:trans-2,3-dihydro-3-hydroxyanthranilate isomerase
MWMDLSYHTLDVFTTVRFGGNPLAVVLDAGHLTSAQMQVIAREFNLSETVFILPPDNPAHSAKVRIFTPGRELPFAGHPTVGTAALLAVERGLVGPNGGDAMVVLEEVVGTIRAMVHAKAGQPLYAEFGVPKLPEPWGGEVPPDDRLAAALGLSPTEINFENHKPTRFSAGVPYTFVPVRDLEIISRAVMVPAHWNDAFGANNGAYVYCRQTLHTSAQFHARMFAPDIGEDPATGSAAAAFGAVLGRFDLPGGGAHSCRIEQGHEMGRPSEIRLETSVENGLVRSVRVGGHIVMVARGTLMC